MLETIIKTVAVTSAFWFVVFLFKKEMKFREEQERIERNERNRGREEIWKAIRELRKEIYEMIEDEEK